MNFLSNVVDSIPVVGHVKGIVHYAVGDCEGGNKAMYQATRTSVVLGAGAAGSLAGPAGAVAAAMYAGAVTDTVASITLEEPQGIVKGCKNIADDVKGGKNPMGSIASTGFQVAMDGVGGLGMGGVSSATSQLSKKAVETGTKNIAKKVVEKAVVQAEIALVSSHVYMQADNRTKDEEKEQRDREERDREERERQERRAREQQEQRAREEREQQERRAREQQEQRAREEREQQQGSDIPERNSGSTQPPRRNRGNRRRSRNDEPGYFAIFKNLLKELLNDIFGVERPYTRSRAYISQIFQNLSQGQINYLSDIIERLYNGGILDEVLRLVIRMFSEHFPEDISLLNFQSLMEFVAVYVQEEIEYRTEVYRSVEMIWRENDRSVVKMAAKDLKETIVSTIINLADIVRMIVDIFENLKSGIESEPAANNLYPNFRDIFAAVYHYFKHRNVPGDGILTIGEYYEWIRRVLEELGGQQRYRDLVEAQTAGDVRANVRFEMYVVVFGRRIRIVVKFEGDTIILASCFVRDATFDDDEEGMVWIVIRRF
ncbi:Protein of unknown function [Cotesia congregata]|uniref:Uncharacterized protein n=1 Tax=Cotesia congregata TaxID=51543 RepID=A0A8J2MMJ2_COTCN|nr:Protein of unknown function [Cotesia congregata]